MRLTLGVATDCGVSNDTMNVQQEPGWCVQARLHNLVDRTRGIQNFKYPRDRRQRSGGKAHNDFEAYRDPETLLAL